MTKLSIYVDCEARDQGEGPDWVRLHRSRCPVCDPGEEMHPTDLPGLPLPHAAGIVGIIQMLCHDNTVRRGVYSTVEEGPWRH